MQQLSKNLVLVREMSAVVRDSLARQPGWSHDHLHPFICVPGRWSGRSDFVTALADKSDGLLAAGDLLTDTFTRETVEWQMFDRDPDLVEAFMLAGGTLPEADLNALRDHSHLLYVFGRGGSVEAAWSAMHVVSGLLDAGGIAVKVDSGGIVHTASAWRSLTEADNVESLYRAYVAHIGDGKTFYSCGMHNLGYADATVSRVGPDEALGLLEDFHRSVLDEGPALSDRDTIRLRLGSPRYRLTLEGDTRYPKDSPFHNPYGIWRLQPVASRG